jgi:peroxiredoxin
MQFFLAVGSALLMLGAAGAGVEVGQQAPDFELKDSSGKAYKLSSFRGQKKVVLEFFRSGSW